MPETPDQPPHHEETVAGPAAPQPSGWSPFAVNAEGEASRAHAGATVERRPSRRPPGVRRRPLRGSRRRRRASRRRHRSRRRAPRPKPRPRVPPTAPIGPPWIAAPPVAPVESDVGPPPPVPPDRRDRAHGEGRRTALVAALVGGLVGALVASGVYLAVGDDSSTTTAPTATAVIVRPSDRISRTGDIAADPEGRRPGGRRAGRRRRSRLRGRRRHRVRDLVRRCDRHQQPRGRRRRQDPGGVLRRHHARRPRSWGTTRRAISR